MYRGKETECGVGWCAMECYWAIFEGKLSLQSFGIVCMILGFVEMWVGGVAYSVSSQQTEAAGAWWAGFFVFTNGLFGFIRTFQCCKCFKYIAILLR